MGMLALAARAPAAVAHARPGGRGCSGLALHLPVPRRLRQCPGGRACPSGGAIPSGPHPGDGAPHGCLAAHAWLSCGTGVLSPSSAAALPPCSAAGPRTPAASSPRVATRFFGGQIGDACMLGPTGGK
jgi:hypothetical protein